MYGYFDTTSRELIEVRLSTADECPDDARKNLLRVASARASVLASLQLPQTPAGGASDRGAHQDNFPVWSTDSGFVIGVGKPVSAFYPIIAICAEDREVSSETRAFLRFALAYVGKSLTEYVYSKPVWPEGLAQATLRLLSIGYFVVNRSAEIEIDGRDGDQQRDCDFLTISHNRLSTSDAKERAALSEAIRLAAGEERQTAVVSVSGKGEHLKMVLIAPFERADSGRALVLFETRGTDHFALREHFFRAHGITRSEALVAHEVLNGRSTAEASSATGLSLETVRSYLKQVFCKTGTHRQSELIALYYAWSLPVGKTIATAEMRRRH